MRLVFAGTPAPAVPALEALLDSRHEVVAVLTRPDARSGRGRRGGAVSPVKGTAQAAGVPVLQPASLRDDSVLEALRDLRPDCCPVVAYGALVPPAALDIPVHGWANLHFSLLPAWRGAAPVQRAVMAGDRFTGASVFRLEAGLDTGPVYAATERRIEPTDTSGDLLADLAQRGAHLLLEVMDALEAGTATATAQPDEGVTLAPKLTADDARVDPAAPAAVVDAQIRGCTPEPGAWALWRDERTRLGPVSLRPEVTDLDPGELRVSKREVLLGTGTHAVALGTVQAPGKRAMAATDWARGVRPSEQERLA